MQRKNDATEERVKKNGVNLVLIPTGRCKSCKKIVCYSRTDRKYVKAAKIEKSLSTHFYLALPGGTFKKLVSCNDQP